MLLCKAVFTLRLFNMTVEPVVQDNNGQRYLLNYPFIIFLFQFQRQA